MAIQRLQVDETYLKKLNLPYKVGTVKKLLKRYYFVSGGSRKLMPDSLMPPTKLDQLVGKEVAIVGPDKSPVGIFVFTQEEQIKWFPHIICYIPPPPYILEIDRLVQLNLLSYYFEQKVLNAQQFDELKGRVERGR